MGFRITPAPQAYVLAFITLALFLAATNVQGGWLYIIDSLLLSLLIFSLVSPINQTRIIKFNRNFSKSVYEGDKTEIEVEIENPTRKIVSFIEIIDAEVTRKNDKSTIIKAENKSRFFIEITQGDKGSFKYFITPELRGIYTFQKFIISSFGPFGLFKFSRSFKFKDELIVFPDLPVISAIFLSGLKGAGYKYSSKTRHNIEASLPYNIREYRRGDNKKLIHWRSTARLNKLMVKELENEQSLSIQIVFDNQSGTNVGSGKENNFEYLLKYAGGILKLCIEKDYKVEFIYAENGSIHKITEVTPWKQVLDTLAYMETDSKFKARDLLKEKEIDFNSIIIPFFLKPEKEDIELLNDLFKQNYSILPVFADIKSFDKNAPSVSEIIAGCQFKSITIKSGEKFLNQIL